MSREEEEGVLGIVGCTQDGVPEILLPDRDVVFARRERAVDFCFVRGGSEKAGCYHLVQESVAEFQSSSWILGNFNHICV